MILMSVGFTLAIGIFGVIIGFIGGIIAERK
jgi:hypothetical protein